MSKEIVGVRREDIKQFQGYAVRVRWIDAFNKEHYALSEFLESKDECIWDSFGVLDTRDERYARVIHEFADLIDLELNVTHVLYGMIISIVPLDEPQKDLAEIIGIQMD